MVAELTELKSSFNKHSTEISSLKKVAERKSKVDIQEREVNQLYDQQDNLGQYTSKHSLKKCCILSEVSSGSS